jgi:hypothetical protein
MTRLIDSVEELAQSRMGFLIASRAIESDISQFDSSVRSDLVRRNQFFIKQTHQKGARNSQEISRRFGGERFILGHQKDSLTLPHGVNGLEEKMGNRVREGKFEIIPSD